MNKCSGCNGYFKIGDKVIQFTHMTITDNPEGYTDSDWGDIFCPECTERIICFTRGLGEGA